ncbi:MAG: chorismate synthase [Erysipelotrichaceae bacterium]|nr:chorismate synthase [Erysipelotrichaceae bacterium]
MKNTFGNSITLTIFGESHGPYIGGVLDGLPPGLKIDADYINKQMEMRKPYGDISTTRKETDEVQFVSGVLNGYSEGTPLAFLIANENIRRNDYDGNIVRPSHADYAAQLKYEGYQDKSGGGHFSGRLTAVIVAAGAILREALEEKGIIIGSHISMLRGIRDDEFSDYENQIRMLNEKRFATLSQTAEQLMIKEIEEAREQADSLGGVLETAICGLPGGIGEPWFDSLEGLLAHGIFSIGAVKGIEFGSGFAMAEMKGSEANDQLMIREGRIETLTNHNGGINGGISNGMPVIFRTVIKPTPSIGKLQLSVDPNKMTNEVLSISGRHDPVIIHRARTVVDCLSALIIADAVAQRYGYMWLTGESKWKSLYSV